MEKYLFLDFDGVLNTARYAKLLKTEGIDPFDEYGPMFDPLTINNLKTIVDQTNCKIVLSSTWRNEVSFLTPPIKTLRAVSFSSFPNAMQKLLKSMRGYNKTQR